MLAPSLPYSHWIYLFTLIFFKQKPFYPFFACSLQSGFTQVCAIWQKPAQIIHLNLIGGSTYKYTVLYFCFHSLTGFSLFFAMMTKVPVLFSLGIEGRIYQVCCLSSFSLSFHPSPFLFLSFEYRQALFYGDPFLTQ